MRIARIGRPDALYDASIPAQTFEEQEHAILNQIEFDEIVGVNLSNAADHLKFPHVERYGNFLAKISKDVNRV